MVELVVEPCLDAQEDEAADGGEQDRGGAGKREREPDPQRQSIQLSSHNR